MPCFSPTCYRSPASCRLARAVQRAERLLCWSLAAGMTTATTDLTLDPQTPWWPTVWPLPWYLTCLSIPAWAALRAREKNTQCPPDEDIRSNHWEQAA